MVDVNSMLPVERAKRKLSWCMTSTGNLHDANRYIAYKLGDQYVTLDDEWTAGELRAIADYMDAARG